MTRVLIRKRDFDVADNAAVRLQVRPAGPLTDEAWIIGELVAEHDQLPQLFLQLGPALQLSGSGLFQPDALQQLGSQHPDCDTETQQ